MRGRQSVQSVDGDQRRTLNVTWVLQGSASRGRLCADHIASEVPLRRNEWIDLFRKLLEVPFLKRAIRIDDEDASVAQQFKMNHNAFLTLLLNFDPRHNPASVRLGRNGDASQPWTAVGALFIIDSFLFRPASRAGEPMSYGASFVTAWRQSGISSARFLKARSRLTCLCNSQPSELQGRLPIMHRDHLGDASGALTPFNLDCDAVGDP
jgi:hypothetical protein